MLEQSKKFVNLGVEAVNVGSKLIHKKGVFVVFNLSDEAADISSLDMPALKAEWVGQSIKVNVAELVETAKKKLDLVNKDVQAKVVQGLDLVNEAGVILEDGVAVVKKGLAYVEKVKALFV